MVFSMFLNTYSIETINKIQSSITEHSTVQEIQKIIVNLNQIIYLMI